jgi:hypothetical protein
LGEDLFEGEIMKVYVLLLTMNEKTEVIATTTWGDIAAKWDDGDTHWIVETELDESLLMKKILAGDL